jgi:hypothetical protein
MAGGIIGKSAKKEFADRPGPAARWAALPTSCLYHFLAFLSGNMAGLTPN